MSCGKFLKCMNLIACCIRHVHTGIDGFAHNKLIGYKLWGSFNLIIWRSARGTYRLVAPIECSSRKAGDCLCRSRGLGLYTIYILHVPVKSRAQCLSRYISYVGFIFMIRAHVMTGPIIEIETEIRAQYRNDTSIATLQKSSWHPTPMTLTNDVQ